MIDIAILAALLEVSPTIMDAMLGRRGYKPLPGTARHSILEWQAAVLELDFADFSKVEASGAAAAAEWFYQRPRGVALAALARRLRCTAEEADVLLQRRGVYADGGIVAEPEIDAQLLAEVAGDLIEMWRVGSSELADWRRGVPSPGQHASQILKHLVVTSVDGPGVPVTSKEFGGILVKAGIRLYGEFVGARQMTQDRMYILRHLFLQFQDARRHKDRIRSPGYSNEPGGPFFPEGGGIDLAANSRSQF